MNITNKAHSRALASDTRGLSTVEYVIILCLLAVLAIGTWNEFGSAVRSKLGTATGAINNLDTDQ